MIDRRAVALSGRWLWENPCSGQKVYTCAVGVGRPVTRGRALGGGCGGGGGVCGYMEGWGWM